ncbi:hypothetical protein IM543_07275 [Massilia sp. UMI-21]|nr:hypothetical protein IM543_07275 [Massilia sp. UMI-21]
MQNINVRYLYTKLDIYFALQHTAAVSTILLQENSFKPASSGLFFILALPGQRPLHDIDEIAEIRFRSLSRVHL